MNDDAAAAEQEHDDEMPPSNPLDMFILSHDALLGTRIDQTIPPGWSARPTKNAGVLRLSSAATAGGSGGGGQADYSGERREDGRLLEALKGGVPGALRCAVWATNVVRAVHPDLTGSECDEYGTLKKVRVLDHGWSIALKQIFPDETDEADAPMPDFGLGDRHMVNLLLRDHGGGEPIPESGVHCLKRVLYAAQQSLGIEYCPVLPDLTALLLTTMEESYAYATIREMLEDSSHFFALSRVEHVAFCKTFSDLTKRVYPQTHAVLRDLGVLTPNALDPILKRIFVTLLRREHVLRIIDLFTLDGMEVIYRFGTALVADFHSHMSTQEHFRINDATSWWDGVHNYCRNSRQFSFEAMLEDRVYGFAPGWIRSRVPIFPQRDVVERLVSNNLDWAEENNQSSSAFRHCTGAQTDDAEAELYEERPLGFLEVDDAPIVLARHAPERQRLAEWFPSSLKSTKLELIYSTNVHGRTVERFYHHCAKARHTITLLEVLDRRVGTTVGMFATQTWHRNTRGYGNGECFLFRLRPDPRCFKWSPTGNNAAGCGGASGASASASAHAGLAASGSKSFDRSSSVDDDNELNYVDNPASSLAAAASETANKQAQRQFADQVMISGDDFISMGIGKDGASGLRLNEDLTRGSASPAMHMGFGQESLLGDETQVFDVGLVEVYRLVREVDGKPVDG